MKGTKFNVVAVIMVLLVIILLFNTKNNNDLRPEDLKSYTNSVVKYSTTKLNVRNEPSINGEILKILDKNEQVRTYDTLVNGFTMMLNEDSTLLGWISVQYLQSGPVREEESIKKEVDEGELSPVYGKLEFVRKELRGWKYNEVVTIPVEVRKKVFFELVQYQEDTGDDEGAYEATALKFDLTEKVIKAIGFEGALKKWPMPDAKERNEYLNYIDPYLLKSGEILVLSRETALMPEIAPENPIEALERVKYILPGNQITILRVSEQYHIPWYEVIVTNPDGNYLGSGWVNSTALVGQTLQRIN